jgi:hypothetical protein
MNYKLVKVAGELYLTKADFHVMAKDLDDNTLVFCHSEIHMNDEKECIRHSSKNDHCNSCQPLIGSTKYFEGFPIIQNIFVENFNDGDSKNVECNDNMDITFLEN